MGLGDFINLAFKVASAWEECNKKPEFRENVGKVKDFYSNVRETFGSKKVESGATANKAYDKYASLDDKELRHLYYNSLPSPEKDILAQILDERGVRY